MARTWLITGSSRGLGRAIAETVLSRTADQVVLTARNTADVEDLVQRYPGRAVGLELDVTDPARIHAAIRAAIQKFSGLDVIVNNAGYAEISAFEETSPGSFRRQMEVNFFGVVEVCRAVVPHLRARGTGHVIQISAISGRMGVAGLAADTAAKFAVEGFSESLALELAPLGINLTLVEPGGIRTDWGGSSMRIRPIGRDYQATVGQLAHVVTTNVGREPSDPALCAQSILLLAQHPNPPARIVLGTDALDAIVEHDRIRTESDHRWRSVSEMVDFRRSNDHN